MTTTRFVPNLLGIKQIGASVSLQAYLKAFAEQVAETVRGNAPRDTDADPHYADQVTVDTGLDELGRALARINANKWTANFLEYGTAIPTPVFRPLRAAAEQHGLFLTGGKN